ncbi:MAG: acyltransferase [Coriobacteriales bacterium]|nr:acyltransferase [Coriobacteriales bacterium]
MTGTTQTKLPWVDAAKGLAILGIVAVHASQRVSDVPGPMLQLFGAGRYGVQVFFLVSGLAILMSVRRRNVSGQLSWRAFFVRRLARIVPLAYLGTAANIVVNNPVVTPLRLGLTLVFLTAWTPDYNGLLLGGWVLSVEFAFYALTPLVSRVARSARSAAIVAISAVVGAAVLGALAAWIRPSMSGSEFLYFWPPAQMPFFALGILIFFLTVPGEGSLPTSARQRRWASAALLAAAVALRAAAVAVDVVGIAFLYPAILAVGFWLSAERYPGALVNRATRALGKISYSMFIWHFFVLDGLARLAGDRLHGVTGLLAFYALGVLASAAVGWVSHRTIEPWGMRLIEALGARIGVGRPPAPEPAEGRALP